MAPVIRGNSLYAVVNSNTWTGAKNEAKQLGGDLVTINNREEDFFVQSIFGPSAPLSGGANWGYWMGLYRDSSSSGYSWSDWKWISGQATTYQNDYFKPGETGYEPNGGYSDSPYGMVWGDQHYPGGIPAWNDIQNDGNAGQSPQIGITEIPLTSSITFSTTPKEGVGVFTTSINLSAGTSDSRNLAEGATVYWKVSGITTDDLATGQLSGSGTITNGKLDLQHSLKTDADTGEKFEVSVFSDAGMTQQIGAANSELVLENTVKRWTDPSGVLSGTITGTDGDDIYEAEFISNLQITDQGGTNTVLVNNSRGDYGYGYAISGSRLIFTGEGHTTIIANKKNSGYYGFHISDEIFIGNGGSDIEVNLTGGFVYQNNILNGTKVTTGDGIDNITVSLNSSGGFMDHFYGLWFTNISLGGGDDSITLDFRTQKLDGNGNEITFQQNHGNPYTTATAQGNVDFGAGNDSFTIRSLAKGIDGTSVNTGTGNDAIRIFSRLSAILNATVDTGAGDDELEVTGTVEGEYGISNSRIFLGSGNDKATVTTARDSLIDMGDGDDSIVIAGKLNEFAITQNSEGDYVVAKKSDDLYSLTIRSAETLIFDDSVFGGNQDPTLQSTTATNNQLILTFSEDLKVAGGGALDTSLFTVTVDGQQRSITRTQINPNNASEVLITVSGRSLSFASSLDVAYKTSTAPENKGALVSSSGAAVEAVAPLAVDTYATSINIFPSGISEHYKNLVLTGSAVTGYGNSKDNTLTGNDANNTLDGLGGADTMIGGKGNDTYVVDHVGDVVTEITNEGIDTVESRISYTLGDNVENLTLTGSGNIDGTGNSTNNTITGNDGANILNGNGGADTLIGGRGNDTYIVNSIDDIINENGWSFDIDNVVASINWTLGAKLENLTLTGSDAINGTGNTDDNIIIGNDVANILDGGNGGKDILTGGGGSDIFAFSSRPQRFRSDQADHITDFSSAEGDKIRITKRALGITSSTVSLGIANGAGEVDRALSTSSLFVYDTSNGELHWNQNGTGRGAGTGGVFAVLDNRATLSSGDFTLI
jgi:Ca2+-binding RTX toxin-like protein